MAKKIVFVLIGLVALILFVPAVMKPSFRIERSIEIAQPAEVIFPFVSDFSKWKDWSHWSSTDPGQKVTISGSHGQVGHKMEWDGKINGKGVQTVISITENKSVASSLIFTEPNSMESVATLELSSTATGTKVTWSNEGKLDYPVGRLFGPFLDGMVGPDFEKGLMNLKKLVEK